MVDRVGVAASGESAGGGRIRHLKDEENGFKFHYSVLTSLGPGQT